MHGGRWSGGGVCREVGGVGEVCAREVGGVGEVCAWRWSGGGVCRERVGDRRRGVGSDNTLVACYTFCSKLQLQEQNTK